MGSNENMNDTSNMISEKAQNMRGPDFVEIEWTTINWDQIEFPIEQKKIEIPSDVKSIKTKEEAIVIGEAIIENCWKNNKHLDYALLAVIHSIKDNIWRFEYSVDQRDKNDDDEVLLCEVFYVAMDGNDGKIIKAWVEE